MVGGWVGGCMLLYDVHSTRMEVTYVCVRVLDVKLTSF